MSETRDEYLSHLTDAEILHEDGFPLDGDNIGECPFCGEIGLLTEFGCEYCEEDYE